MRAYGNAHFAAARITRANKRYRAVLIVESTASKCIGRIFRKIICDENIRLSIRFDFDGGQSTTKNAPLVGAFCVGG